MTYQEKIVELKGIIQQRLIPLITNDYIVLDLPYYTNIGDSLIWQGTLDLLKHLPYKCLYSSSIGNYIKPNIDKGVIILFMGGGNFGDIWYGHQLFREKILESFPDNPIIQLPQSIYFNNFDILQKSAEAFSKHKHITICCRDQSSLDIVNKYFINSNNILLPDMAFCIDISQWIKYIKPAGDKILFLDRKDCEKDNNQQYKVVPADAEIHDWPTMEKNTSLDLNFHRGQLVFKKIDKIFHSNLNNYFSDFMYRKAIRKHFIKTGVQFISSYSYIYTTRLHVAIISMLLDKDFSFFDNSYGKNSGFYNNWLQDVERIEFIKNHKE